MFWELFGMTSACTLVRDLGEKDDCKKFWEQFGICPELGMHEDSLLRWNSSGYEQITLQEHIGRMKEGQNDTHYITGESIAVVTSSAFWETPRMNADVHRDLGEVGRLQHVLGVARHDLGMHSCETRRKQRAPITNDM